MACAVRLIPVRTLRAWLTSRSVYLKRIQESDLVASLAGGDSFADVYGLSRLVYVTLPQILALVLGKPLVQLPQTFGPFRGALAKAIGRLILRRSTMIYSRDRDSMELVRVLTAGSQSRVRFCFDMGFALEASPPSRESMSWFGEEDRRPVVGINPSGLLYLRRYTGDRGFGLRSDYRMVMDAILELCLNEMDCRVVLVPHAYKAGDSSESDTLACAAIMKEWQGRFGRRLHSVQGDYSESEIKYLIGKCDFFVGSRMHACIAAVSQGVPTAALAYSGKFLGVLQSLDMADLVVDLRVLPADGVVAEIGRLYRDRDQLRSRLVERLTEVHGVVRNLFVEVAARSGHCEEAGR
jgi:polysaccharide pyruvyl transferase WcaK-like protein